MATRASSKKIPVKVDVPLQKTATPQPEPEVASSAVSVEDLVGGPAQQASSVQRLASSNEPEVAGAVEEFIQPQPRPKTDRSLDESTPVERPVITPASYPSSSSNHMSGGYRPPMHSGGYRPRFSRDNRDNRDTRENGYYIPDANVPTEEVTGYLSIVPDGHGFLRPKFIPSDNDIYISQSQIRKFQLRSGDAVTGQARRPKENERYWGLLKVEKVNGNPSDTVHPRVRFDDLTPIYPKRQLILATGSKPLSTRIIDLLAPIGFGQRGLVVSPPKAGKTTILKEIAAGISANHPDSHLMAALIGERPEEVTDLSRSIKGEVIASHFDESPEKQAQVAEIALERAKRLVETGKDVIILLDSITRLARAYNLNVEPSGRTLSGGFDPAALYPAKRFLGAARNCEEGGSLTIIGTALVDTGSRMDELIYEEFKGTGNMELHLDRNIANKRIFPAINVDRSGTRQDNLLFDEDRIKLVTTLRNMLNLLNDDAERIVVLCERLSKTKDNDEFLATLNQG